MKFLNLSPSQSITATGGGIDVDTSAFTGKVMVNFNSLNTAGTTPTHARKVQASAGLARGLEYTTAGTTSTKINQAANANVYQALTFTQSGARSVKRVAVRLKKFGTIASGKKVTCRIETNNAGAPSGTLVAAWATTTVDIDTEVGTTEAWVVFTFARPVDLADATVYHLVFSADYTASTSNYVGVVSTTVASGGTLQSYDGSAWTASTTEKVMVYADQYTFADISGVTQTGASGTVTVNEGKEFEIDALEGPIWRVYDTIGGTSNPAFSASCNLIASRRTYDN